MSERYASLKQEENTWKSIKEKLSQGNYSDVNSVMKQFTNEEKDLTNLSKNMKREDTALLNNTLGNTDILSEFKKVQTNVETMVLALDEKATEVMHICIFFLNTHNVY